jgi:Flp pilus assembly protein TadD
LTISRAGTEFDTQAPASDAGANSAALLILANGARHFLGLDRLDFAQSLCDLALSEDERNADIHSLGANILDRQGDWPGSLACLRRAYALAPQAPQVRLNLAMALLRSAITAKGLRSTKRASKSLVGLHLPRRKAARRFVISCCVPIRSPQRCRSTNMPP